MNAVKRNIVRIRHCLHFIELRSQMTEAADLSPQLIDVTNVRNSPDVAVSETQAVMVRVGVVVKAGGRSNAQLPIIVPNHLARFNHGRWRHKRHFIFL